MALPGRGEDLQPRGWLAIAALGLLLTLFFLYLGFPYERVAARLIGEVERRGGATLRFEELGPAISIFGLGLQVRGLEATNVRGERLVAERARVRPAWSLSWLRREPALRIDLEGIPGDIGGVVTIGSHGGFRGRFEGVDLAHLPTRALWPDASLAGILDADVDLHRGEGEWEGRVELHARDGNFGTRGLPLAIPFATLDGRLLFGDGKTLEVEALELESPLFQAEASGSVGAAPRFASAPLDLRVQIVAEPAFRPTLSRLGVSTGSNGSVDLRVSGTPARPIVE